MLPSLPTIPTVAPPVPTAPKEAPTECPIRATVAESTGLNPMATRTGAVNATGLQTGQSFTEKGKKPKNQQGDNAGIL